MYMAIDKGNLEEAKELSEDVKQNLEKIHQHGRRADAIVKGMLQHSSNNSGQKELSNVNAICDEFLKLSYHGLRAKDKSFNAHFFTVLDPEIGKVTIQAQGFGRVILNLVNNAFYAVNEKNKLYLKDPTAYFKATGLANYEPTVSITTTKFSGKIQIIVKDNGTGIPQKVIDKIFQPFFTTKPTGEGTGLGLGLSYDIITTGHSGTLETETKEGEGTSFIITIPV
jgi:two-component system, NtrC family, sensor kinase